MPYFVKTETIKRHCLSEFDFKSKTIKEHKLWVKNLIDRGFYIKSGLVIDTDLIGKIHISGSGAGGEATAAGVISDIVHLASELSNHNAISKEDLKYRQISDELFSFLIIANSSSENINSDVLDMLAEHNISIKNSGLINDGNKSDITCFFETEEITSINLQEFLNDLKNLSSNFKTLRIEK